MRERTTRKYAHHAENAASTFPSFLLLQTEQEELKLALQLSTEAREGPTHIRVCVRACMRTTHRPALHQASKVCVCV